MLKDAGTRQIVLESLQPPFDRHLAQAQNVRSMFIVLNDEVLENRVIAVGLIGRMSTHNPAYVRLLCTFLIDFRAHSFLGYAVPEKIADTITNRARVLNCRVSRSQHANMKRF